MKKDSLKRKAMHRITGLFVRYGLIKHPYGREYAKENYTLLGGKKE